MKILLQNDIVYYRGISISLFADHAEADGMIFTFANVSNSKVVDVGDQAFPEDWIGGKYKYVDGNFAVNPEWVEPAAPATPRGPRIITVVALKKRIGLNKLVAIQQAAKTDPVIEVFIGMIADCQNKEVELDDDWFNWALAYFTMTEPQLLTEEDVQRILM